MPELKWPPRAETTGSERPFPPSQEDAARMPAAGPHDAHTPCPRAPPRGSTLAVIAREDQAGRDGSDVRPPSPAPAPSPQPLPISLSGEGLQTWPWRFASLCVCFIYGFQNCDICFLPGTARSEFSFKRVPFTVDVSTCIYLLSRFLLVLQPPTFL